MTNGQSPKCSTSSCDNRATVCVGPMLVCGSCRHGMFTRETPVTMSAEDRAQLRVALIDWCEPTPPVAWQPEAWVFTKPGHMVSRRAGGIELWVDIRGGGFRSTPGWVVPLEVIDVALRSVDQGSAVWLAHALQAALDDGDCLRGVIARAIEASNSIADRDAEDAIQEMLQHLLEAEPEGHDDRIEWARMEGANAMLEVIQQAGYGARGIADNRDGLRKAVAELAVSATMPRKPEPEFEAALLQREVEQLRAQLAEQAAAHERADRQANEWRAELDKMRNERDEARAQSVAHSDKETPANERSVVTISASYIPDRGWEVRDNGGTKDAQWLSYAGATAELQKRADHHRSADRSVIVMRDGKEIAAMVIE
jgi:hypothetical protein